MNKKESFVEGAYYHIYNRGNSKQIIFLDDQDRDRFIKILYLYNSHKNINFRDDIVEKKIDVWDFDRGHPLLSIGAWTLMSNHFHLLLTIPVSPTSEVGETEGLSSISIFIKKVSISYSKYFNKKYERTGGLFETSFKSEYIDTDEYLKYMFSYIHLNPLKFIDTNWKESGVKNIVEAEAFLRDYKWSSYQDYCGIERPEGKILSKADFPDYFETNSMTKEIFDWLNLSPTSEVGGEVGGTLENKV